MVKDKSVWTHKQLVGRMAQWLKVTKRMTVVISELVTQNRETPDVIAWGTGGRSILIECKVSRADFLADDRKWFRRHTDDGMGDKRYIAAPKRLLKPEEMPEGWGLLEVTQSVCMVKESEYTEGNKRNECMMLMSALRRLEVSTAVYVVSDETMG